MGLNSLTSGHSVDIKYVQVSTLFHATDDVTCGESLNEPKHKLSDKIEKAIFPNITVDEPTAENEPFIYRSEQQILRVTNKTVTPTTYIWKPISALTEGATEILITCNYKQNQYILDGSLSATVIGDANDFVPSSSEYFMADGTIMDCDVVNDASFIVYASATTVGNEQFDTRIFSSKNGYQIYGMVTTGKNGKLQATYNDITTTTFISFTGTNNEVSVKPYVNASTVSSNTLKYNISSQFFRFYKAAASASIPNVTLYAKFEVPGESTYVWDKLMRESDTDAKYALSSHTHTTDDITDLKEYIEENATAIKETNLNIETVSAMTFYPGVGEEGRTVKYNDKYYKATLCSAITLDFTQIKGNTAFTSDDMLAFINKDYPGLFFNYEEDEDWGLTNIKTYPRGGLICGRNLDEYAHIDLKLNNRRSYPSIWPGTTNGWNQLFIDTVTISAHTYYETTTSVEHEAYAELYLENINGTDKSSWEKLETREHQKIHSFSFASSAITNFVAGDYLCIVGWNNTAEGEERPFVITNMQMTFKFYPTIDYYNDRTETDCLVWRETTLDELTALQTDVEPCEENSKCLFRVTENNSLNVTDYTAAESAITYEFNVTKSDLADKASLQSYLASATSNVIQTVLDTTTIGNNYLLPNHVNDGGKHKSAIQFSQPASPDTNVKLGIELTKRATLVFQPYISYYDDEYHGNTQQVNFDIESTDGEKYSLTSKSFTNISDYDNEKLATFITLPLGCYTIIGPTNTAGLEGFDARFTLAKVKEVSGSEEKYEWNQLVKRSELKGVAKTNSYKDIDDKPILGEIQLNNCVGELPSALKIYENVILRKDTDLYTCVIGASGLSLDLVEYANHYPTEIKDSNISPDKFKDFININLIPATETMVKDKYITINGSLSIPTYIAKEGFKIGAGSSTASFKMQMINSGVSDSYEFLFDSVTITTRNYHSNGSIYAKENFALKISLGTTSADTTTYIASETAYMPQYDEEGVAYELYDMETTVTSSTMCNTLLLESLDDAEPYGRRGIIRKIVFNNFKYNRAPGHDYNRTYLANDYWKKISSSSSGSIKLIDLT